MCIIVIYNTIQKKMRISKKKVAKTFEMRNEHFLPLQREKTKGAH